MRDSNNYYADSIREFNFVLNAYGDQEVETGISVYDELQIDDNTSVITEREVSFNTPEETKSNYLKVIEVQELSEAEVEELGKFKLILKKIFTVFFKGKKWNVAYGIFCTLLIGLDIALDNWFGAMIMLMCLWISSSPIKFAKEVKKILTSEEKKDALRTELNKVNLGGLEYLPKDSIKLFVKDKQM